MSTISEVNQLMREAALKLLSQDDEIRRLRARVEELQELLESEPALCPYGDCEPCNEHNENARKAFGKP